MLLPSPNFDIVQEKSRFMTGSIVFQFERQRPSSENDKNHLFQIIRWCVKTSATIRSTGISDFSFWKFYARSLWEKSGSPGRIRTSDQPVNSRLLYRWATEEQVLLLSAIWRIAKAFWFCQALFRFSINFLAELWMRRAFQVLKSEISQFKDAALSVSNILELLALCIARNKLRNQE